MSQKGLPDQTLLNGSVFSKPREKNMACYGAKETKKRRCPVTAKIAK